MRQNYCPSVCEEQQYDQPPWQWTRQLLFCCHTVALSYLSRQMGLCHSAAKCFHQEIFGVFCKKRVFAIVRIVWVRPDIFWGLLSLWIYCLDDCFSIRNWLLYWLSIICQHKDAVYTCQPFLTAKTKNQGNLSRQQEYPAQQTTKHLHCWPKNHVKDWSQRATHIPGGLAWGDGSGRISGKKGPGHWAGSSRGGQKADTHQDRTSMSSITAAARSKRLSKGIWTIWGTSFNTYLHNCS